MGTHYVRRSPRLYPWSAVFYTLHKWSSKNHGYFSKSSTFADDTSIIITNTDLMEFTNSINENSMKLNRWFESNSLLLNIDKTYYLQFFLQ